MFRESRKIGQRADDAEEMNGQRLSENSLSQNELSRIFASKTPPEIPAQLPRLVKTVLQNTPQKFKAAVAQAMFPPLATYPQKLSFVYIDNQAKTRITTGLLNDMQNDAEARHQPPSDKGKRLKIFYTTQASVKPPTFVIFVNDKELMHFSYVRYLENRIRDAFGFEGTYLKFIIRERKENE